MLYNLFIIKSIIDIAKVIGMILIIRPFTRSFLETLLACENLKLVRNEFSPAINRKITDAISRPDDVTFPLELKLSAAIIDINSINIE